MDAISSMLQAHTQDEMVMPPEHPSIAAAVSQQQRGFLAKEWETALDDFSVEHSSRKLAGLLKALWVDYTDQIWRNRNDVAHHRQNKAQQAEEQTWAEKLHWFLQNPQVIAQQDLFLLNYTTDDIQRMPGRTRKKLAQNLQTVQKALATEVLQRKQGQGVITSYFKRIHSTRVHPIVGQALLHTTDRTLHTTDDRQISLQPDSSSTSCLRVANSNTTEIAA